MKTILFDVDDTLYSRLTPFENACRDMFEGIEEEVIRKAFLTVSLRGEDVFYDHQNGKITSEQMYIYRYTKGFEDAGITITDQQALKFYELYQYHLDHLQLPIETERMLDVCKDRFEAIGIITNGPSAHQRGKLKALGMDKWIDENLVIVSGDYIYSKPDREIFLIAEEKTGKKGKDIIYVGDSYRKDILPAVKLGWTTILLNRDNSEIYDSYPDYQCTDVEEITEILKKL